MNGYECACCGKMVALCSGEMRPDDGLCVPCRRSGSLPRVNAVMSVFAPGGKESSGVVSADRLIEEENLCKAREIAYKIRFSSDSQIVGDLAVELLSLIGEDQAEERRCQARMLASKWEPKFKLCIDRLRVGDEDGYRDLLSEMVADEEPPF